MNNELILYLIKNVKFLFSEIWTRKLKSAAGIQN